jgi:outer membrane receptor protein involved in Fe transport
MTTTRIRSSGIAATLLLAALPAAAQERSAALEEIVVTATKRGEVSVQDIPAGVSAISGEFLESQNIRSLEDVARLAPSLQLSKQATGDLQPIIRGIQSPGAGTVGVYFDETVITGFNPQDGGGRTPDTGAYDIARVEILKGPQGTLFGASSMSGTLRIISNKPDPSAFDANVSVRGDTLQDGENGYGADGMLNIPLGDQFALRGVGWYEQRGGFIDQYAGLNAVTKIEDANEIERVGGRLMARWQPGENVIVDAYYLHQEFDDDGPQGFSDVLTGNSVPVTIVEGPPDFVGQVIPPFVGVAGDRVMTAPALEFNESEIDMYGATVEFKTGAGSIVATISQYENDNYSVTDTTGTAARFGLLDPFPPPDVPSIVTPNFPFPGANFPWGVTTPYSLQQTQDREVLSGEVRFSSDLEGPINFVTGVFYQDDDQKTETLVVSADPVTGTTLCRTHADCIADPTSAAAQTLVFGTNEVPSSEAYAVFGHADFEISDAWQLGAGVRYYDADLRNQNYTLQAFQGSIPFTFPPRFCQDPEPGACVQLEPVRGLDDTTSQSKTTWDASLSYKQSEDVLYYLRGATGFRQGGINDSNSAQQLGVDIPPTYDPDTLLSLEAGAKTSWNDDRLIANAAYFKMFWDDIQVPGQDPTGSVNFIDNAAKAEIDGLELELAATPTDSWLLTFAATWLDARLTEDQVVDDPDNLGFPAGREGDEIPKAPEWALSGSAEYRFPVFGDLEAALRANASYVSESNRFLNDSFEGNAEIGDYFLLNVGAGVKGDNWEVRLFVNNVTDEVAVLDVFGNGADPQHKITVEPLSVGAEFLWRYR